MKEEPEIKKRPEASQTEQSMVLSQAVFSATATGFAALNADGLVVHVNEPWRQFVQKQGWKGGRCGDNYPAMRLQEAVAGDATARKEWEGIKAVQRGESACFDLDFAVSLAAGMEWFALRAVPLRDGTGGVLLALENITRFRLADLAEQTRVKVALRQSEARWLTFFRTSPVGIGICLPVGGRFIEVNETLIDMLGYAREELLCQSSVQLGIWGEPADWDRLIQTLREQGMVRQYKASFRRKSGVTGTMLVAAEVIQLDGRQQVLGIFSDVTAGEQQNEELRRAKEEAEVANRAKSAFLANMSHEIRTPMNAILGYAQLLQRDEDMPAESREKLNMISRSGQHLLALIEDVLEMSKIEAGRVSVQPVCFNLPVMLGDLAAMFRMRAEAKGLEFKFIEDGVMPRQIMADEGKIRRVVVNLLGNALKFTQRGRVELMVGVYRTANRQWWLGAKVTDTGPGIPAGHLAKLFQQFEPAASEHKFNEGTGLGLAISREFARLMGGDITVTSQEGQGSSFHFELPVEEGDAREVVVPLNTRRVVGLEPGQPPVLVLLADDNAPNRNWLKQLLILAGCQVVEAGDGEETIRLWEKWKPRLILMDLRMPVLDGFEATRQIKASAAGRETVILALTATVLEESRRAILAAGAADLLGKPLEEHKLFEKMRTHLGVNFVYESEPGEEHSNGKEISPELRAEWLAKLPPTLRSGMHDAIANGDLEGFEGQLKEVALLVPGLARYLGPLAERYDYDLLLRLLT